MPCCLETGFLMSGDEGARLADPGLGLSWFSVNWIPVMPGMNPTWFVHAPVQRYHSVSSCIAQRNSAGECFILADTPLSVGCFVPVTGRVVPLLTVRHRLDQHVGESGDLPLRHGLASSCQRGSLVHPDGRGPESEGTPFQGPVITGAVASCRPRVPRPKRASIAQQAVVIVPRV